MQSKNNLSYQRFVKRRARQFFPFLMTDTVKNWTLNVEAILFLNLFCKLVLIALDSDRLMGKV